MKFFFDLFILLALLSAGTKLFPQSAANLGIAYGSFNYDISGTKYTGDGGVLTLDGQLSPTADFSLIMSDGKFDDRVISSNEGSITYKVNPNIGVLLMGSQIKLATVQETDASLGISYNINASELGFKVFAGSNISNYGKFYTYGTKVNLAIAEGGSLILSYKTEDRKQKATTVDARFVYELTSKLGFNLGYRSTEAKNAAGSAVALKGSTTYAGIFYKL